MRGGATVSVLAQEARLPRTTVYRILETLCDAGFALRDADDDRYRPTISVRSLSSGFVDEAWVREIAEIRANGYAITARRHGLHEEISLSVPVLCDQGVRACLSVRFDARALPLAAGIDRLVPKLKQCAAKITAESANRRPQARRASAEFAPA